MTHYGDFPTSHTAVCLVFDTFAAATGAPTATTNFAAADIQIYKDGGTTQRSSANGITVTTSFDSNTGLQFVKIDTSDNTDAGFYAAGSEYSVAVADITADGQTLRFWLGAFSIERAGGVLALLKAGTAKVDVTALSGDTGAADNLETMLDGTGGQILYLKQLNIANSTGSAILAVSSGGNGAGAEFTGTGSGAGLAVSSGTTALGAIRAIGAGTAAGVTIDAGGTGGVGLKITGVGTGAGLTIQGGASGKGATISAGAADTGLVITGTGGNPDIDADITGNLTGSIGSISAGGVISGAHAAAELNAIADALLDRNMTTGTDNGTDSTVVRTVRQALRRLRNKEAIAAGTGTVYKENDSTTSWTYAATTTAGDPLSAVDPT